MPTLTPTGCIAWPSHRRGRYFDAREGGMWVYAYWLARYDVEPTDSGLGLLLGEESVLVHAYPDPFAACYGVEHTLTLPLPHCVTSSNAEDIYPSANRPEYVPPTGVAEDRELYLQGQHDAGVPILAGICLGSTPHVLYDSLLDALWHCATEDLTWSGKRLLRRLSRLYGRPAHLVTYLDS